MSGGKPLGSQDVGRVPDSFFRRSDTVRGVNTQTWSGGGQIGPVAL